MYEFAHQNTPVPLFRTIGKHVKFILANSLKKHIFSPALFEG